MVGYLRPSATITRWTTFPIGCCNCAIQDDIQDGRHGFASTLQKDSVKCTGYFFIKKCGVCLLAGPHMLKFEQFTGYCATMDSLGGI